MEGKILFMLLTVKFSGKTLLAIEKLLIRRTSQSLYYYYLINHSIESVRLTFSTFISNKLLLISMLYALTIERQAPATLVRASHFREVYGTCDFLWNSMFQNCVSLSAYR